MMPIWHRIDHLKRILFARYRVGNAITTIKSSRLLKKSMFVIDRSVDCGTLAHGTVQFDLNVRLFLNKQL